jgi:predicted kinase
MSAEPWLVADRVLAEVVPHPGRWRRPVLVALMGLPGSGKTELARGLAARMPLTVLSTDEIRLRHGLASGPAADAVIRAVAPALLRGGGGVVWDGIHLTRAHRDGLRAFAAAHDARLELVYARADDAVIRARLRRREDQTARTAAEGKFVITPAKLAEVAAWLEEPGPDETVTVVDTTAGTPEHCLAALEARLRALLSAPSPGAS